MGGKLYLIDMKLDKNKVAIVSHKEYYVNFKIFLAQTRLRLGKMLKNTYTMANNLDRYFTFTCGLPFKASPSAWQ